MIVRLEDADRFARLHQQSLVILELFQSCDDGLVSLPTAGRAPGSAVDDKILWTLGNLAIEVVHQHAHSRFLLPAFAGDLIAAGRANRDGSLNFSFDGHA